MVDLEPPDPRRATGSSAGMADADSENSALRSHMRVSPTKTRSGGILHLPIGESDVALVAALQAGRHDAASVLFDRYGRLVARVLARVMGPDPELPDLIQDVFVAALSSVGRLEDPDALRHWLTSIAVFVARGRIRSRTRWRFLRLMPFDELPDVSTSPVPAEASEALRCTYQVLEELPANERIAFALRFIDQMELTDVAEACDVSLATIKRRLHRAQRKFAQIARRHPVLAEWVEAGDRWAR